MRAKRRFEERKRKLKLLNEVYDWGYVDWDGKHVYRDWSRHWIFIWHKDQPKIVKWWREDNLRMSESGHSAWVHAMMTKPHRSQQKALERAITAGRIEPDEALFPIWGKPWIYYW
jgi:hypothetical protein